MSKLGVLTAICCLLIALPLRAQAEVSPPQRVTVTAADGLMLVGDFYAARELAPALLLLHGQGAARSEWDHLIAPLLDGGYNVLAVDQRGFGETGGTRDLATMIDDVQVWFDWLHQQPSVGDASLATIGASMGTVPALGGCAHDFTCLTTILISPGDFPLLDDALFATLSDRSLLIVVGRGDNVLYDANKLFTRAVGEAQLTIYKSSLHGVSFFQPGSSFRDRSTQLILNWLDGHSSVTPPEPPTPEPFHCTGVR